MNEVEQIIARMKNPPPPPKPPEVDGGRGPRDDDPMEDRVRKIESTLAVIEATLPKLATNDGVDSRVSKAETKIIMWVVGAVVLTGVGGRFLVPSAPAPAVQPAPIILQVPSAMPAQTAPPAPRAQPPAPAAKP